MLGEKVYEVHCVRCYAVLVEGEQWYCTACDDNFDVMEDD